jgi:hypothetical protein
MHTPSLTELQLRARFLQMLDDRLSAGAAEYGNASFGTPPMETQEEILAEILDVAGWAYVMWVKMQLRLKAVELAASPFLKNPLDNEKKPG